MIHLLDPDKIYANKLGAKIKLLILLAHILVLFWVLTNPSLTVLLLGFVGYILIGTLGGAIGFHRYFCHRSFRTSKFWEWYMLFAGSMVGIGSCLSWAGVHRHHHAHSDTPRDAHSPIKLGLLRTWLTMWGDLPNISPTLIKDLIKDKKQVFTHKHYFKIVLGYVLLLSILSLLLDSWIPIISFWAFPCITTFNFAGLIDGVCHLYGYSPYNVIGTSKNNLIVNFITLGNGLHNNHHGEPNNWNYAGRGRWYEIDPTGWVVRLIKN